ncbi:MAG: ArsR family transcriptional regulator [Pelagimonas sp.]|uniref:arsenate reductase/protein-tyrosine-phosphatase family protein n=1 Tax=Pelagimonas sp. TaxID=2073170 RepID=UPI003D6A5B75
MEKEVISQLSALAHERRLAVFRLLMRRYPDAIAAGEIAQILELPASSLSTCLAHLRQARLVTQNRDGTSLQYTADAGSASQLVGYLSSDCCRGRPEQCLSFSAPMEANMSQRKHNVLFLCSGNSARSIFAETLLRAEAGDRFDVYSAGTRPQSELNPYAVDLLASKGFDTSSLKAKNVNEFRGEDAPGMDFVFTVCDSAANEECPPWPGQPMNGHWGQPDPVKAEGTDAEKRLAFQQVYGALRNRVRAFAALPFETLDRASLQNSIDDIAKTKD